MYPTAIHRQYSVVDVRKTLAHGYSFFVPVCTYKDSIWYKYSVISSNSDLAFDVYFVPSIKELHKYANGEQFNYYVADGCFGKNYLSFTSVCKGVAKESGLLIIMHGQIIPTNSLTEITIRLEELVSETIPFIPTLPTQKPPIPVPTPQPPPIPQPPTGQFFSDTKIFFDYPFQKIYEGDVVTISGFLGAGRIDRGVQQSDLRPVQLAQIFADSTNGDISNSAITDDEGKFTLTWRIGENPKKCSDCPTKFDVKLRAIFVGSGSYGYATESIAIAVNNRPPEYKRAQTVTEYEHRNDVLMLVNKANDLSNSQNYEQAIVFYDKALSIDPNDPYALDNKANAFYNLRQYQSAISYFNKVLKTDPNDVYSLMGKARSLQNLGKYEEATSLYDRVLQIEPSNYDAMQNKKAALEQYSLIKVLSKKEADDLINKQHQKRDDRSKLIKELDSELSAAKKSLEGLKNKYQSDKAKKWIGIAWNASNVAYSELKTANENWNQADTKIRQFENGEKTTRSDLLLIQSSDTSFESIDKSTLKIGNILRGITYDVEQAEKMESEFQLDKSNQNKAKGKFCILFWCF